MSKRVWWILGGVVVLSAGVYFGVNAMAPRKPVSPHEMRIRELFAAIDEPASDLKILEPKDQERSGFASNTTVTIHEASQQVTLVKRWPGWRKANPEPITATEQVRNASDAKAKLAELLPELGLSDLKYKILTVHRLETRPALITKDGVQEWEDRKTRPHYVIIFRETHEDPRYYLDGLRQGTVEFCTKTGKVLLFHMDYPAKAGEWQSIITEEQAARKVREAWKSSSKSASVSRTTVDPIWMHYWTDPDLRHETPMSGGYVVRGLDAKGDLQCIGFVVGQTGEVRWKQCGDIPDSVNWNGRYQNFRPSE